MVRVSDDLPVQHQQVFARGLLGDACAQFADEMLAFGLDFVLAFFYMAAQFADALPLPFQGFLRRELFGAVGECLTAAFFLFEGAFGFFQLPLQAAYLIFCPLRKTLACFHHFAVADAFLSQFFRFNIGGGTFGEQGGNGTCFARFFCGKRE